MQPKPEIMFEKSHRCSSKAGASWWHHCILVVLLFASDAIAQDWAGVVPPKIELSTDKPVYRLYEPVVLRITLTNVSEVPQQFGPIRFIGTMLRFRVMDPDGETILALPEWSEHTGGWRESEETATPPGATVGSDDLLLSDVRPITASPGRYRIKVGYPLEPKEDLYHTGEVEYTVVSAHSARTLKELIEPFGIALRTLKGTDWLDNTVLEALERVSTYPAAPAYLVPAKVVLFSALDMEQIQLKP